MIGNLRGDSVHIAMDLGLAELDREARFEENPKFEPGWWQPLHMVSNTLRFEVRSEGLEVARVELDESFDLSHYEGAPDLRNRGLEIVFFEVAATRRGRGIGSRLVAILASRYPDRRLFALSEEADGFWSDLGWERFEHPEGTDHWRPLYVQPI